MTHSSDDALGRRRFLKGMATVAGAAPLAPLAPAVFGAPASAQSEPPVPKEQGQHETERLAAYAAALRYEDLPPAVIARAKDCIAEAVGVIAYGAELPWSRMVIAYAQRYGAGGKSAILGTGGASVNAPAAALANGALAHAFELDSTTLPNSGSHPAATLFTSTLAVAQEQGLGGRDLITAMVAGGEVMFRIGNATKHSNEARGFHAPGTTGPFGAAVAVGRMRGFDAVRMTNALGIAGSLACGLLEFVNAGSGAMVKRLHLGRAAESGVLAASLAAEGFTGPSSVLEGEFGFLRVFCNEWDMPALTRGLGTAYLTPSISMKRYACHMTAQNPIEATADLRAEHSFSAADIVSITIVGDSRMLTRNNIPVPEDEMMAQYSVPFSVALSLHRDPRDPRSFDASAVRDRAILDLAGRVKIVPAGGGNDRAVDTVTVRLKDGRELARRVASFKGTPQRPFDQAELKDKFMLLTRHLDAARMSALFQRLQHIESEPALDWLRV